MSPISSNKPLSCLLNLAIACLFVTLSPIFTNAHGDDDHGDTESAVATSSSRKTVSSQNKTFDLVAQYDALEPGKPATCNLYLSDYETNAPISGATIGLSINSNDSMAVSTISKGSPGLYSFALTFSKTGHYDILFDITTPDKSDIIELKGFDVELINPEASKTTTNYRLTLIMAGLGIIVLVIVLLSYRSRRNSRHLKKASLVILLLLSVSVSSIYAHGGDEHDENGGTIASTATPGYMSKASQFLLGVRTLFARTQPVSKQISALGRIVSPPTSQVQVYAPQSGLLVAAPDVSYPKQGDWVVKGQAIAALQILDQFVIRAPISGVVSSIHAVPGEQVDPAHELFTIYDYTKVWVEASLFENDLIHLEAKPPASLSGDLFPGESFQLRFMSYKSEVDPSTHTVTAIYEVSNPQMTLRPGMVVNVHIESEKRLQSLVVPSNSVMDWEGQKVVFVHEQPEIFEMRPIKIVGFYGDQVAIEGPLAEGDRVVTIGAHELLSIPHRLIEDGIK